MLSNARDRIDFDNPRMFIYVIGVFCEKFRGVFISTGLSRKCGSRLRANPKNKYLFETTRYTHFTPRRVQQIVKEYREAAGIAQKVHPHLFRHQIDERQLEFRSGDN